MGTREQTIQNPYSRLLSLLLRLLSLKGRKLMLTNEKYMNLAGLLAVIGIILVRIYPDMSLLAVIADVAFWWFICAIGNFADWKFFRRWGYVIFLIMAGGTVIVHLLNW